MEINPGTSSNKDSNQKGKQTPQSGLAAHLERLEPKDIKGCSE